MTKKHDNEGVSPVVGVMLMLVVTIIIAAIVSAFAGGIWSGNGDMRKASIVARTANTLNITFDHMGGDGFSLEDLTFILDQGEKSLRITNATLKRPDCNLTNKAGVEFIRPGDTLVLKGVAVDTDSDGTVDSTRFTTTAGSTIDIHYDKEFTWRILHQQGDSIMAQGRLVFNT